MLKKRKKNGITFIGLPGCGKSTIGKKLSQKLNCRYIDLDLLILEKEGIGHNEILHQKGDDELKKIEEKHALKLNFENLVFAPPGSIIYSSSVMKKTKKESLIIYLIASASDIKERLGEKLYQDGIIGLETKGLENVIKERLPLYEKYADFSINTSGLSPENVLAQVLIKLKLNN